jgi:S-adenosylmethionine decarboxylase
VQDLAPEIFRQRLIIEGFYTIELDKARLEQYLLAVAAHLGMRTYGEPIVFAPAAGMGRRQNAGYDAFVPLIDSGISAYVWTGARFFSVVLYTCKGFDDEAAVAFTREFFQAAGELASASF